MATPTNGLPGQQITGNEGQDIDALIKAEVERLWADKTTQLNTQQANIPQNQGQGPIKLNVFGQEFSFNDPVSASAAVEQALNQVRERVTEQTLASVQPQLQQRQAPTEPETNKFSREKFADIVAEDPLKGIDYALNHLLFEGKSNNAADSLKTQLNAGAQQRQVLAAYQFRERYPDFVPDTQSVAALDQIRQGLGLSADNPDSWEAAYALGRTRGVFRAPQQPLQQQVVGQNPYIQQQAYPPTFGRQSGGLEQPDWLKKAEEMPADQLEKLLTQFSR